MLKEVESTKKYNSGNKNHPSQEDLTGIDNLFEKLKVKLIGKTNVHRGLRGAAA